MSIAELRWKFLELMHLRHKSSNARKKGRLEYNYAEAPCVIDKGFGFWLSANIHYTQPRQVISMQAHAPGTRIMISISEPK
jgi:hypothetical protein